MIEQFTRALKMSDLSDNTISSYRKAVVNVYAIGQIEKDHLDEHIIEVPGEGYIIAIPYANERNIPEGFFQKLLDKVAEQNKEELPVVMTAQEGRQAVLEHELRGPCHR